MERLPDEVLRQVFLFMTFKDLDALGYPLEVVMQRLGIRPPKYARWVFYRHRYVPFEYDLSEITRCVVYMNGRVYPSLTASDGWVGYARNCYSPWEYQTIFQDKPRPEMVPRVLAGDPKLEITYRGKRKERRFTFQQGREVDVMDAVGEWWKGSMVASKDNLIRYHYHGWDSKWDRWYPNDSLHVAPLYSITRDWREAIRVGLLVEYKKTAQGGWHQGVIARMSLTTTTVWVRSFSGGTDEVEIERTSERLMFHGAHTGFYRSPFRVSNVVWKDEKGTEVYQYRVRKGNTVLTDHVLSESETRALLEDRQFI